MYERHGELGALEHARGVAFDRSVACFSQSCKSQNFVRSFQGCGSRQASELTGQRDCLYSIQFRNENMPFRKIADAQPYFLGLILYVLAEHMRRSLNRLEEAKEGFQQSALTGSIGTKKAHYSARYPEGKRGESFFGPVANGQIVGSDDFVHSPLFALNEFQRFSVP